MSHFVVMLKITSERLARHAGDVPAIVAEMLAPYDENSEDERFVEFEDQEDELRERYATESRELYRWKGELLSRFSAQFRVPGSFGTSIGGPEGSSSHRLPEGAEKIEVPNTLVYGSFDAYARDYHGHAGPDPKTGRYGYWYNPKKTWDWYSIGGHWSGYFAVKHGRDIALGRPGVFGNEPTKGGSDITTVADIDMDAVATQTREKAEEFWAKWEQYKRGETPIREKDGKPDPWFRHNVRDRALDVGLLRVIRDDGTKKESAPEGWATDAREWAKCDDNRRTWFDALSPMGRDEFFAAYIDAFCPISPYAVLDDEGWHAPGKMGWFGCSSETPEEGLAFRREVIRRFIKESPPETTLVAVDCHI